MWPIPLLPLGKGYGALRSWKRALNLLKIPQTGWFSNYCATRGRPIRVGDMQFCRHHPCTFAPYLTFWMEGFAGQLGAENRLLETGCRKNEFSAPSTPKRRPTRVRVVGNWRHWTYYCGLYPYCHLARVMEHLESGNVLSSGRKSPKWDGYPITVPHEGGPLGLGIRSFVGTTHARSPIPLLSV